MMIQKSIVYKNIIFIVLTKYMIDEQLEITNLYQSNFQEEKFNNMFGQVIDVVHEKNIRYMKKFVDNLISNILFKLPDKKIIIEPITPPNTPIIETIPEPLNIPVIEQCENFIFNKNSEKTLVINSGTIISHRNIFIDNSRSECHLELSDGTEKDMKKISLLHPKLFSAIINTTSGSFYLDIKHSSKKLLYSNNKWNIIGKSSFFPQNNDKFLQTENINAGFGSSVSISGNGNVYVIGSYLADNGIGKTWIYSKINNVLTLKCSLIGTNNIGASFQGISVSTNFDGSVIAIGGSGDNGGSGACWIFVKDGNEWMENCKLAD